MSQVPRSYPVEPGLNYVRCGDSYSLPISVNGMIPGTDFGAQFQGAIEPLKIGPGFTSPLSWRPVLGTNGPEYAELRDQIQARIDRAYHAIEIDTQLPQISKNRRSLWNLLTRAEDNLDAAQDAFDTYTPSLPPGPGEPIVYPESLQKNVGGRLTDALRWLRCAEYWTLRLKLYQQALDAYEPPPAALGYTARAPVKHLGFVLPEPEDLPPGPGFGAGAPESSGLRTATVLVGVGAALVLAQKLLR